MYRIKELREEAGLSQRALSKKIGVTPKAVNFWESGNVEPSAKYICAMCDIFECSADYLLGREDEFGSVNVMRELTEDEKNWLMLYAKLGKKNAEETANFAVYLLNKEN